MTVKISKIKITIGKKKISLTLAEARDLQAILNETLARQDAIFIQAPIIVERYVDARPYIGGWIGERQVGTKRFG